VGEDVTVIGEVRREGLRGTVVRETEKMVVIADDAGFLHWLMLEDVTRTNGVYW
jgi:RNase P/RNase MRP subunit p29